ncbi:unnamed protein product [Acanthoscelides obtectus]|uniref:Uncharacterized protein n=1 Tax=Acanthoscelides obtectus TaxID=200917 RepID=A0A9P0L3Z2_ACAOB|nr:unnamed protein product [Acanthoscelides obtectus]CAK1681853.1 hypothetical protein AOBTE_LOCUS33314 [Acanthoscelides obtectus]
MSKNGCDVTKTLDHHWKSLARIGDALGVDWASLVAESRPRQKPTSSAKLRWEGHNVLLSLGEQRELTLKQVKVKTERQEVNANGIEVTIKQEPQDPASTTACDMDDPLMVLHPIAAVQSADREKQWWRKSLFSSAGAYRRALSARRDLLFRRHLCNLPHNDTYAEPPKRHDPELLQVATRLFERCL